MTTAVRRVRRTLLFTDIEGSTRMWDDHHDVAIDALDHHDAIVTAAVRAAGGIVVRHTGDGVVASFQDATAAIAGAVTAQIDLVAQDWSRVGGLRVRMGIHTGDILERGEELHGWAMNTASRLNALAHGGQILVSGDARDAVGNALPPGVRLVALGSHRVRDVARPVEVFSVRHDDLPHAFPGLRTASSRLVVTAQPGVTVGRDQELLALRTMLCRARVVTLVGPPGIGKTRLALELGARLGTAEHPPIPGGPDFSDGVALCQLTGVPPDQIEPAIAAAVGVQRRTHRSIGASTLDWMKERHLLLVLDSCEDAPEPVAAIVAGVMASAPHCAVLATSRRPLGLDGEQVMWVRPLAVGTDAQGTPAASQRSATRPSAAVDLFLARAAAGGVALSRDAETLDAVTEVCRAVAGVPLAIELLAANTAVMSLDELRSDVARSGSPPADGSPSPHEDAVAGALRWSYDGLDRHARRALQRTTAFAGSFDRGTFAAVCAPELEERAVVDLLGLLVDRSLVISEAHGSRVRFRVLEPVRAFASAFMTSDERAALHVVAARHLTALAAHAARELHGPDEARWAQHLALEFDNLRSTFAWALVHDLALALRLVAALWEYGFMRMRTEIYDWAEQAAAAAERRDLAGRADVLGVASLGAWVRENPQKSLALAAEAFRLEDQTGRAGLPVRLAVQNTTRYATASVTHERPDHRGPRDLFAEIVEISESLGVPYWLVNVSVLRSIGHSLAGRTQRARAHALQAVALARASRNPSSIAWALFSLGLAVEPDDPTHAEQVLDEALGLARSVDNRWIGSMAAARLVSARRRTRGALEAVPLLMELIDTWERAGHRSQLWTTLDEAAVCLAELRDDAAAVTIHSAVGAARLAMPALPSDSRAMTGELRRIHALHGAASMRAWERRADHLDLTSTAALATRHLGGHLRRAG